ncbi:hypothetical protein G6F66_015591 [Rhizopus arrhizus]|nr:hypothetical protein G6F66_015591 [Rhizopus arrhizus]
MPAARATAIQWMVWLVEPPVAISAMTALMIARSSMIRPSGRKSSPSAVMASARSVASRVSASRRAVAGLTNDAPGSCTPIASSNTWLELAVP